MMNYPQLIARICSDGQEAAAVDYAEPKDAIKLEGATLGFSEAAGTKSPAELKALLGQAMQDSQAAFLRQDERYWFFRCRHLEIEWAANVVSAALLNSRLPVIVPPTVRGALKAAEILGVAA
jgi:uncharacterized protein YneR